MVQIAPSILAADFSQLGEQVLATERAGAHRIHIDVMDGHFVPNLSMGPVVVHGLKRCTRIPLEVHLMVAEPASFIDDFIKAGSDTLIVHKEVLPDPRPLLRAIRQRGQKVGLAINPDNPIEELAPYLADIDLALCMTVHPGRGGQPFLPDSPQRISRLRELIDHHHPECELEVDGGINLGTARMAFAAGANVLVVGTGIFRHPHGIQAATSALVHEQF